ncbi:MAG: hypothetical protein E2O50_03855 [Gammaproteobacteria bacterium]|nr:MAG: hypothetical protein E2O50_03855 [Gammaproteobacteria bacterium]
MPHVYQFHHSGTCLSNFYGELPDELIAQSPLECRDAGRLLLVHGQGHDYQELKFSQLGSLLRPGDLRY